MKKIYLIIYLYFCLTSSAYAYLDPGTGSVLLSAIFAAIATIKHYWRIIKNFFYEKILKKEKLTKK